MYELAEAGVQHELFEGVFSENKTVGALSGTKSANMNVLKNLHPNSFENIESPCQMKLLVAAELWRKSLKSAYRADEDEEEIRRTGLFRL